MILLDIVFSIPVISIITYCFGVDLAIVILINVDELKVLVPS